MNIKKDFFFDQYKKVVKNLKELINYTAATAGFCLCFLLTLLFVDSK